MGDDQNSKKTFEGEIQNKRKNGVLYTAHISISPVLDKDDNILYFVGIERNITKEKEVDKAKTEFVSLASHQLRTPLSAVSWYAEMLLSGDAGTLNDTQKKYVEEVYRGNRRMIELVNSLLNVSRIELGTFVVQLEPTDVVKLALGVIDEQKIKISERKLQLLTSFEKEVPLIPADPNLLHMIIDNLLSNAVKYTPEGGTIEIGIQVVSDNVLFKVSDTGYGIPKNQQDHIFTKLFRADNVREKDTDGTGLGLYIVKQILDNSCGKVRFESLENKGTTFYVEIPLSGMTAKGGTRELTSTTAHKTAG